jgi:hypothetical protein
MPGRPDINKTRARFLIAYFFRKTKAKFALLPGTSAFIEV